MEIQRAVRAGLCLVLFHGAAWASTFTLYSTGFNSSGHEQVAGTSDAVWTLESTPTSNTPATPFVTIGSALSLFPFGNNDWLSDNSSSEWISPSALEQSSNTAGEYVYQETFNLTGLIPSSVVITGKWSADNYGTIVVNGVAVTGIYGSIPNQAGEFRQFTNFVLNSSNANFVSGVNTIQFEVMNNSTGDPDVTGLNVDFISTFADPVPEPGTISLALFGMAVLGARAWSWRK